MIKQKMVTYNYDITTAEVLTLDVASCETRIKTYDIGGRYTDAELLKKLQKVCETDTLKLVRIVLQTRKQLVLGMNVNDFIHFAQVLRVID